MPPPPDRDKFIPVKCLEEEYGGRWYWKEIKGVTKHNGEKVDKQIRKVRSDFKAGDTVKIRYMSKTYRGVVIEVHLEGHLSSASGSQKTPTK